MAQLQSAIITMIDELVPRGKCVLVTRFFQLFIQFAVQIAESELHPANLVENFSTTLLQKKKFCVINDDYTDLSNHHLLFPVCPPPSVIILFAVVRAKPGPKLNIYRQPLDIHFCQCLPHNFIANLGPTSLEADLAGGPGRALVEKLTRIHSSLPSARFGESTELLHFLCRRRKLFGST